MDKSIVEKIYNDTFAGCTMFYRDTTLDEKLISKYKQNQILQERGFTDMSFKGGGLKQNLRYLIASSKGKNLSAMNPQSEQFGHILLKSNSFFKILDIYKLEDKTQILLLNISEESIELFRSSTSNIEKQVIEKGRESLNLKLNTPAIAEHETTEWRERTKHPIGMSDKGEFFYQQMINKQDNEIAEVKEKRKKPWWKKW
ncbi:hypothetical protein N9Q68_01460 [Polaribacter sp.]|nr:hypothetical protein [Polaribacter sp.]